MNPHRANVIRSVRCESWKAFLCGTFLALIYIPIRTVYWFLQNGLGRYFTTENVLNGACLLDPIEADTANGFLKITKGNNIMLIIILQT